MKEAASRLGVTRWTIQGYRDRGWLPKRSWFTPAEVEACRASRGGELRPAGPLRGAAARHAKNKAPATTPAGGGDESTPPPAPEPAPALPALPRAPKLNLPCKPPGAPKTPPAGSPSPPAPPPGDGGPAGDFFNEAW